MNELTQAILHQFTISNRWHTKPLYRCCRAKSMGYSLNKFRDVLFLMYDNGDIKYNKETEYTLPYWSKDDE